MLAMPPLLLAAPDAKAYEHWLRRLDHARTLSGRVTISVTSPSGDSIGDVSFAFRRPKFSRCVVRRGGVVESIQVSDGQNVWTYDAIKGQTRREQNPSFQVNVPLLESIGDREAPGATVIHASSPIVQGRKRFQMLRLRWTRTSAEGRVIEREAELLMNLTDGVPFKMSFNSG